MVSVDGAAGSFILLLVGRERPGWTSLEDGALYTGLSYFRVILIFTCICVPYKIVSTTDLSNYGQRSLVLIKSFYYPHGSVVLGWVMKFPC
jgi:hypothetical protein